MPKDRRVLGAVYPMTGGYWLWHLDERMTFEQAKYEVLWMAAMEHETAVESGMDSQEAWELVGLPDSDTLTVSVISRKMNGSGFSARTAFSSTSHPRWRNFARVWSGASSPRAPVAS